MIWRTVPCSQRGTTVGLGEGFSVAVDAGRFAVLLERERALAVLGAMLSRARGGAGRVVVIEGRRGSGRRA